jgi:hypothetical protein
MATEKTVSGLLGNQLPDFVKGDHPKFRTFLEKYYAWLEDNGSFTYNGSSYNYGNTVYHIENAEKYRDIDETLDPFVSKFKQELLPYFPESTALDLRKIVKGAREFYNKKGTEESVKWLFRVLYNEEIEILLPKKQILIASDGKWKRPLAFQLNLSEANQGINPSLLSKRKGTGAESKATCTIEAAYLTVDSVFGNQILEIYVSNLVKEFTNGENIEIYYLDEDGVEQLFAEKITGAISSIVVDSNINTDPQQKRRGLSYNIGDPVVVYGGLDSTATAADAIAVVGDVEQGSIESVVTSFGGYGFTEYSDTEVLVLRNAGDDPGANTSAVVRVSAIDYANVSSSQESFLETIRVGTTPIEHLKNYLLSEGNWVPLTNNRNILIGLTETSSAVQYQNNEPVYANGSSYATANFKGYILNANNVSGFGLGGAACTNTVIIYAVSNTVPLTTAGFLLSQTVTGAYTGKVFTAAASVANSQLHANINSVIEQGMIYNYLDTGSIRGFTVVNGGYGFRSTPPIQVGSYYDTLESINYSYDSQYSSKATWRQPMGATGQIAHIYIDNPGSGYANGDTIEVTGRGYGFSGYINVDTSGGISDVTITSRGEGYYDDKQATVTGSGSGATLTAYGFGDGLSYSVQTGAIGKVKTINTISRGFDYVEAPTVSLKVVDMVINEIGATETLSEGELVYQGNSLEDPVFTGLVKKYQRSNNHLRLFNYSGNSFTNFNSSLPFTSEGGVVFTIDTTKRVDAPSSYSAQIRSTGLSNPMFYGNGKARARAEFYNGLIRYPGFYLGTDGFLSADKKIQNDSFYHNYSYVIESEKSLTEYRNTIRDIVHPIGTSMLAKTIAYSTDQLDTSSNGQVVSITQSQSTTNVTIDPYGVAGYATFRGTTNASSVANVGDILIAGNTSTGRYSVRAIKSIANTQAMPSLQLNFVDGVYFMAPANTVIAELDGSTAYVGSGTLVATNGSNTLVVSGNSSPISPLLRADTDAIEFVMPDYRTNLIRKSNEFSNTSYWSRYSGAPASVNVSISTGTTAPDGTYSAYKLRENSAVLADHYIIHSISSGRHQDQPITISVHAKAAERRHIILYMASVPSNGTSARIEVDLVTGTIYKITNIGVILDVGSEYIGDGWWRLWLTGILPNAESAFFILLAPSTGTGVYNYTGAVDSGVYIWGAQAENGHTLSPYIATDTTVVTSTTPITTVFSANAVSVSGNRIQINTWSERITSDATDIPYMVYPQYSNSEYSIIRAG